jgi:CCR4-NOT transcription complex subunit 7/8
MDNFFIEMEKVSQCVDQNFNYVSMDTEYPGTVYLPSEVTSDYDYQIMRANVENLKLIQVGITLTDASGNLP